MNLLAYCLVAIVLIGLPFLWRLVVYISIVYFASPIVKITYTVNGSNETKQVLFDMDNSSQMLELTMLITRKDISYKTRHYF